MTARTECEAYVEGGGVLAFMCFLDAGHAGPHAARENQRSMRARQSWEASKAAEPTLAEFQGEPQTTAERYTSGATPPPGQPSLVGPTQLTCVQCMDNFHLGCTQRAEIIAVMYDHTKDIVEFFCACFQSNLVGHGVDQSFAERLGDIPGPDTFAAPQAPPAASPELLDAFGFKGQTSSGIENDHSGFGLDHGQPDPTIQEDAARQLRQMAPEPTKQREGDQKLPTVNDGPAVQDRVIAKVRTLESEGAIHPDDAQRVVAQIEESKRVGFQRYGTLLQTFNDRDILEDAIGEARDLLIYFTGMQAARDASREEMIGHVVRAVRTYVSDYTEQMGERPDLSLEVVAGIAVDTIFRAAGGPVLPGE